MDAATNSPEPDSRTQLTSQRGNFLFGMGFALLAGFLVLIGFGFFGIPTLGYFSLTTALAMIAISIAILSIVSFVTLITMRRTLGLVIMHEAALTADSKQQAEIGALNRSRARQVQAVRDQHQDEEVATLSARQDATFVDAQVRTERSRNARIGVRPAGATLNPFTNGQVHPVRDVEGIGEHYGALLDGIKVTDTEKLWHADSGQVAGALNATVSLIESWQCMCELMAVNGIGKQYAELLVRAGCQSIDRLREQVPQTLLTRIHRVEAGREVRIQSNTIGLKIVQSWIDAARDHYTDTRVTSAMGTNGPRT